MSSPSPSNASEARRSTNCVNQLAVDRFPRLLVTWPSSVVFVERVFGV